jgi:hypothetical protein
LGEGDRKMVERKIDHHVRVVVLDHLPDDRRRPTLAWSLALSGGGRKGAIPVSLIVGRMFDSS